jgi:hypothetical protein
METKITVNGKTWIVPGEKLGQLVAWLSSNAVEAGFSRQEVREVKNENTDPRQLLVENVID